MARLIQYYFSSGLSVYEAAPTVRSLNICLEERKIREKRLLINFGFCFWLLWFLYMTRDQQADNIVLTLKDISYFSLLSLLHM